MNIIKLFENLITKIMNKANLNIKPPFYKGMANNPRTDRIANSEVLFTNLPIIGQVITEVNVNIVGDFIITLPHSVGRRCDFFARTRIKGAIAWSTLPLDYAFDFPSFVQVTNITDKNITLLFEAVTNGFWDLEIYFIDFSI